MAPLLPPPTLSFTIPSYDETVLDCRIYHPTSLAPKCLADIGEWGRKAAIVAHPYATLGGSYDDPVVGIVASTILRQGFVVGTFNFRGAGKGRTSWTSHPEQNDYIAFIGFMIYYMHHLSPPSMPQEFSSQTRNDPEHYELAPIPSQIFVQPERSTLGKLKVSKGRPRQKDIKPTLLLAGYSYGAMITTLLPPIISSILAPFQSPSLGSSYAEVRMRADGLAKQQNILMENELSYILQSQYVRRGRSLDVHTSAKTRKISGGVRMGGEEDLRRSSHDSYPRRSFSTEAHEKIRHSMDRVRSITSTGRDSPRRKPKTQDSCSSVKSTAQSSSENLSQEEAVAEPPISPALQPIPNLTHNLHTAYLLISPLQGLVNSLATMFTAKPWKERDSLPENEMKLSIDSTLALFGDDDIFVSIKKLRVWAEKLKALGDRNINGKGDSVFRYVEVEGAGHFWHTRGAVEVLREEVAKFVDGL